MNDEIQKFQKAIKPYIHIWKSIEVTTFCIKKKKKWVNLTSKITLTESPIKKQSIVSTPISTQDFKVFVKKCDIKDMNQIINSIVGGSIKLCKHKIIFKDFKDINLDERFTFRFNRYERGHSWYFYPLDDFTYLLDGEATSKTPILDHDLREKIKDTLGSYATPFDDLYDVSEKFLGERRVLEGNNRSKFTILAPIPIGISNSTELLEDKISIEIYSCLGIKKEGLKVGIIRRFFDGHDERNLLKGNTLKSKRKNNRLLFSYKESNENCRSVTLTLTYLGTQVDKKELFSPIFSTKNPRLVVHEYFDPSFELIKKYLKGEGKDKSKNFESAVRWLLHSCGFCVIHFGKEEGIHDEIDLMAFDPRSNAVIAGECTIKEPDLKGKLSSLMRKVNELREKLPECGILPAMFTPLRIEIPKSDMDKASKNGIAIVKGDNLDDLFMFASKQEPISKIIKKIEGLIPYQGNVWGSNWRQPFGY